VNLKKNIPQNKIQIFNLSANPCVNSDDHADSQLLCQPTDNNTVFASHAFSSTKPILVSGTACH